MFRSENDQCSTLVIINFTINSVIFLEHTPVRVSVWVCMLELCLFHFVVLHTVFRTKQPMARGVSSILFILLFILKISRQDIPLRLWRLSNSSSNTSQIWFECHTASISSQTVSGHQWGDVLVHGYPAFALMIPLLCNLVKSAKCIPPPPQRFIR